MYKIPGAEIPIVHRVLETHDIPPKTKSSGYGDAGLLMMYIVNIYTCGCRLKVEGLPKQLLLTKGDNNQVDDIELYQGLDWLERKHIVGKVRG